MRTLTFAVLTVVLAGCGKAAPTQAGGKPIDHWLRALSDPDPKVRKTAATKLGNVGSADPTVLPALERALQDRDAGVRAEAILALVKFGAEAKPAVPKLAEIRQRDPDAKVRDYATKALEKIDPAQR